MSDFLYTSNFALLGLHEAAAVEICVLSLTLSSPHAETDTDTATGTGTDTDTDNTDTNTDTYRAPTSSMQALDNATIKAAEDKLVRNCLSQCRAVVGCHGGSCGRMYHIASFATSLDISSSRRPLERSP